MTKAEQKQGKDNFLKLHDTGTEVAALKAISLIDPRNEALKSVDKDIDKVYAKLIEALEKSDSVDELRRGLKALTDYKEFKMKDLHLLIELVINASPEDKEIIQVISKKYQLQKEMMKQKNKSVLFGRG